MFNHDAWMKRGSERKKLLGKLKSAVMKKDNICPALDYELARVIFHGLATISELEKLPLAKPHTKIQRDAQKLSEKKLIPMIKRFSNSKMEQYMVAVELYEWLVGLITEQFKSAFSMWESVTFKTERKKKRK